MTPAQKQAPEVKIKIRPTKKYPEKLDGKTTEITKPIENEADKWWHEVYLPMCHPNPKIFHEKMNQ